MRKKIILFSIAVIVAILSIVFSLNKKSFSSVVYIESTMDNVVTAGSGFVYKIENGKDYILTSYHVISNKDDIIIYNENKKSAKAILINYDEYTDVALLEIEDALNLKEVKISSKVSDNSNIFIMGYPEGAKTITRGKVVSSNKTIEYYDSLNVIELKARTKLGNSGGPILNSKNEVIGIMFLRSTVDENLAYAIPISNAIDSLTNKINLGANMTNSTNLELLKENNIDTYGVKGVVVLYVYENYPLDESEILKGDIITKLNNNEVGNLDELQYALHQCKKGDTVSVEFYRNGILNRTYIVLNK